MKTSDLIGMAVAKLAMRADDVLVIFCPDTWSVYRIAYSSIV
jgi:hypothetical protein